MQEVYKIVVIYNNNYSLISSEIYCILVITMKTYWDGDKRIEEYDDKKVITDYTYRLRDFFKPCLPEIMIYSLEAIYVSPITGIAGVLLGAVLSKDSTTTAAIVATSAAAPQALTYMLFRTMEAGLWKRGNMKQELRSWKKRLPYDPKITIEKIVKEETKE